MKYIIVYSIWDIALITYCLTCRFPVAIKNPQHFGCQETLIFLEEIKSMLEIDQYHENIVNLQGIVYGTENFTKGLAKVCFS